MSNEEKQEIQMNDEKRAFIREQIAPKRRSAFKRFMGSVLKTSFFAVLFGTIGSLSFAALTPYFQELLKGPKKETVVLVQPSPLPSPTAAVKPTPTPTPKEVTEKIDAEKIAEVIDAESYSKLYDMMRGIAEDFNHSVVKVSGVQSGVDWFDNPTESKDATSGVVIADTKDSLYILTNYDKISDVNHIQVTFENHETVEAVLQGKDKDTNIAVVSVQCENISKEQRDNIKTAVMGDSYYAQRGTPVLALGNPDGYMYSMDIGIVSGNEIEQYITDSMVELFATNMMYSENGNGFIADLDGNILGIITHQFDKKMENSSCTAISINRVKAMIEKMVKGEERAYFGLVATNIPKEYRAKLDVEHGIYVTEVLNGSPALEAGIQVGDILTDVGDIEINSISNFTGALSVLVPKKIVKVKLIRTSQLEDREKTVNLTVGIH